MANDIKPEIGMGATYCLGSDRYPYTITYVNGPGTVIEVQADEFKRTDSNGPYTESQDYEYTPNPNGGKMRVSKRNNGRWVRVGDEKNSCGFWIGNRRAYRDPHF